MRSMYARLVAVLLAVLMSPALTGLGSAHTTITDTDWSSGNFALNYGLEPYAEPGNLSLDPASPFWHRGDPSPRMMARSNAPVAVVNGSIYVVAGAAGWPMDAVERFDPSTGTAEPLTPLPVSQQGPAVAYNGHIYVFGGRISQPGGGPNFTTAVWEYSPDNDTWRSRSPMATARGWHGAHLVGDRIYIIGGQRDVGIIQTTIEVYDPANDSWSSNGDMPDARRAFGSMVHNDRIYVAGGWNGSNQDLFSEYDATNDSWTSLGAMPEDSSNNILTVVNGEIYNFGTAMWGRNSYRYNPAGNNWTFATVMMQARSGGAAVQIGALVYFIGGNDAWYNQWNAMTWDPQSDVWSSGPLMPFPRSSFAYTSANGEIYTMGGGDNAMNWMSYDAHSYNPLSGNWSSHEMVSQWRFGAAAASQNGKVYYIGGAGMSGILDLMEEYNPANDTWTEMTPMTTARSGPGAATIGDRIYVAGGSLTGNIDSAALEIYDPANDTWSSAADMNVARHSLSMVATGGLLYAIGGTNSSAASDVIEAYDPSNDTWWTLDPMSTARSQMAAAVTAGQIHVLGGYDGTSVLDTHESYDISADSWSTRTALPAEARGLGAGVDNGEIIIFGGDNGQSWQRSYEKVYRYNPAVDSYQAIVPEPAPRTDFGFETVGDDIYVIGGFVDGELSGQVDIYNTSNKQWSSGAPMQTARYDFASAEWNGKIYTIGGRISAAESTVEEYDTATNTWRSRSSYYQPRHGLRAETIGDRIYAMGGYWAVTGTYYQDLQIYDPINNTWTAGPTMPTRKSHFGTTVVNGDLHTVGGLFNGLWQLRDYDIYSPGNNTWWSPTGLPEFLAYVTAEEHNGLVYTFGGYNGSSSGVVHVYDPVQDVWSLGPTMLSTRYRHQTTMVDSSVFVYGGSGWGGSTSANGYNRLDELIFPSNGTFFTPAAGETNEIGVLESDIGQIGDAGSFDNIWFNDTVTQDHSVRFQLRTGSTSDLSTESYIGPDGTVGTYYTTSGESISASHDGDQYYQYRVELETTEHTTTPVLHDIGLDANAYPTMMITEPSSYVADLVYTVRWQDSDPDDNASIMFSYDTDTNPGGEIPILTFAGGEDGVDEFDWDVSELSPGPYYLVADIDDGHIVVTNRTSTPLVVSHTVVSDFVDLPAALYLPNGTTHTISTLHTDWLGAQLDDATLTATGTSETPSLTWNRTTGFQTSNDPDDLFVIDAGSSYLDLPGGQTLIFWTFEVGYNWTPQSGIVWTTIGSSGGSSGPTDTSPQTSSVETRLQILDLTATDLTAPFSGPDALLEDGDWLAALDQIHANGSVVFFGTNEPPGNGDVEVMVGTTSSAVVDGAYDFTLFGPATTFTNWLLNARFDAIPAGAGDMTNPLNTRLTLGVDALQPVVISVVPDEGADVTGPDPTRQIIVELNDSFSGIMEPVFLHYWISGADNDGFPVNGEYSSVQMNLYSGDLWMAEFDESVGRHMDMVSLFVTGSDGAGNAIPGGNPGFALDLVTYRIVGTPTPMAVTSLDLPGVIHPNIPFDVTVTFDEPHGLVDLVDFSLAVEGTTIFQHFGNGTTNTSLPTITILDTGVVENSGGFVVTVTLETTWTNWPSSGTVQVFSEDFDSSPSPFLVLDGWHYDSSLEILDLVVTDVTGPVNGIMDDQWLLAGGDEVRFDGRVVFSGTNITPSDFLTARLVMDGVDADFQVFEEGIFSLAGTPPAPFTSLDFLLSIEGPDGTPSASETFPVTVDMESPMVSSFTPDTITEDTFEIQVTGSDDHALDAPLTVRWVLLDTSGNNLTNGTWRLDPMDSGPQDAVWTGIGTLDLRDAPLDGWSVMVWFELSDAAGNARLVPQDADGIITISLTEEPATQGANPAGDISLWAIGIVGLLAMLLSIAFLLKKLGGDKQDYITDYGYDGQYEVTEYMPTKWSDEHDAREQAQGWNGFDRDYYSTPADYDESWGRR